MKLSIIIPACNEEHRIGPTLDQYLSYYAPLYGDALEVLVVLNGCTDGTEAIVQHYQALYPQLHYLLYPPRLGKGGAVLEGFRVARGELVAFVDADNLVGPGEMAKLLESLEQADVAIGSRWLTRRHGGDRSVRRWLITRLVHLWVRWFLGLRYHDTQCGAKAIRSPTLQVLLLSLTERGWAFDLDLLVCAEREGFRVREVPVVWHHDERGSKVRPLKDLPSALWATLRIRRKRRRGSALSPTANHPRSG